MPSFEPLLNQGIVLESHQSAYDELSAKVAPIARSCTGNLVLVSGLAGLGKSRLVQYYLYEQSKLQDNTPHSMVAWLSADTQETFDKQWHALAEQFRDIDSRLAHQEDDQAIKSWFEGDDRQSNWLLVLDNVGNLDVEQLVKRLPTKGGHVVITTRHAPSYFDTLTANYAESHVHPLSLSPLETEESKKLIEVHFGKYWCVRGHEEEEKALNTLISVVDGVPQMLIHAALFIRKKGITFERYVSQLTSNPELQWRMLEDTVLGQFDKDQTMAHLWDNSKTLLVDALSKRHPGLSVKQNETLLHNWLRIFAEAFHSLAEMDVLSNRKSVSSEDIAAVWLSWHIAQAEQFDTLPNSEALWATYELLLQQYLPIYKKTRERWCITPVAHAILPHTEVMIARKESFRRASQVSLEGVDSSEIRLDKKKDIPFPLTSRTILEQGALVGHIHNSAFDIVPISELSAWQLPPDNPDFIPRPKATEELISKLPVIYDSEQDTQQVVLTTGKIVQETAVSGMGGVGKTELVRHYVHHDAEKARHRYERRFWFNADSETQLRGDFRYLALKIGLIQQDEKIPDDEMKQRIHRWFQIHPGWLIVLDNADDYKAIETWIPQKGGTVLITTRESRPGRLPDEQIVRLEVLTSEEAVDWLYRLSRRGEPATETERDAAAKLVEELGFLPLAIAQVAAYLRQHPETTFGNYLQQFNTQPDDVLGDDSLQAGLNPSEKQSRMVVSKTWNISIQAIEETAKRQGQHHDVARRLLTIMSFLAPNDIPAWILEHWLVDEVEFLGKKEGRIAYELDEYLGQLFKYSLIQRHYPHATLSMHRLVQAVINQQQLARDVEVHIRKYIGIVQVFFYNLNEVNTMQKEIGRFVSLIPNAQVLIERYENLIGNKKYNLINEAVLKNILIGERSLLYYKRFGHKKENEPDRCSPIVILAGMMGCFGNALDIIKGDTAGKKAMLERVLKIQELYYGKDHSKIAGTLSNLGDSLNRLGEFQEAKKTLERALNIFKGDRYKNDPRLAIILNNLGDALNELGEYQEAKVLLERGIEIEELHYGINHPETMIPLTNLANALRNLGNTIDSKKMLERVLEIQESYYSKDHPQVAVTLINLANSVGSLGDTEGQKAMLERALKIFKIHYGKDHPKFAMVLDSLGNTLGSLGKVAEQKEMLKEALAVLEVHYGENHPKVAITLNNLGESLNRLGEYQQAKTMLERALVIFENCYGRNAPNIVAPLTNLGNAMGGLGYLFDKKAMLERALKIKEKHHVEHYSEFIVISKSLKCVLGDLGDVIGQKKLLEHVLKIQEQHYGEDHLEIAITLTNLGDALANLGDIARGKTMYERSLKIKEQHYGHEHKDIADTLISLGNVLVQLNDTESGKVMLERALIIFETHYGEEHPQVAVALTNLAIAETTLEFFQNAEQHAKRAHTIFVANSLPQQKHTEAVIGEIQRSREALLRTSLEYFQNGYLTHAIRHSEQYVQQSPQPERAYHNLACMYHVAGDATNAEKYFRLAIDNVPSSGVFCEYAHFLYQQGRYQEALDNLQRALALPVGRLSYENTEASVVDDCLQELIAEHGEIAISTTHLAQYLIVRCHIELNQRRLVEESLAKWQRTVEFEPDNTLAKQLFDKCKAYADEFFLAVYASLCKGAMATNPASFFAVSPSQQLERFIEEHRHEAAEIQHAYDKRFGIVLRK